MNRRILVAVILGGIASLIATLPARAYNIGDEAVIAKVEFPFAVGEKTLPAGTYKLSHHVSDFPEIEILTPEGKTVALVLAVTRLARRHEADPAKSSVVFDKIGDKYFLSEVWLPGLDGFLVRASKEAHEHVVVAGVD